MMAQAVYQKLPGHGDRVSMWNVRIGAKSTGAKTRPARVVFSGRLGRRVDVFGSEVRIGMRLGAR